MTPRQQTDCRGGRRKEQKQEKVALKKSSHAAHGSQQIPDALSVFLYSVAGPKTKVKRM